MDEVPAAMQGERGRDAALEEETQARHEELARALGRPREERVEQP